MHRTINALDYLGASIVVAVAAIILVSVGVLIKGMIQGLNE